MTTNPPAASAVTRRLDLYAPIHQALRSFMADTLVRLGRLDLNDAAEQAATLGQLEALLQLCEQHLHNENTYVHPALDARQPGVARRIAGEHVEHQAHIAVLRDMAEMLCQGTPQQRPGLAQQLYREMALFMADNFLHMQVEETVHNAALWTCYTDAELAALHSRILAAMPPAEMALVARWMLPALSPADAAAMVNGMKAEAPPEAVVALVEQVRPHLGAGVWAKLAPAIGMAQQPGLVHFG